MVFRTQGVSNSCLLSNEVIIDRNTPRGIVTSKVESLKQEIRGLEAKVSKLEESVDSLSKLQQRYIVLILSTFPLECSHSSFLSFFLSLSTTLHLLLRTQNFLNTLLAFQTK